MSRLQLNEVFWRPYGNQGLVAFARGYKVLVYLRGTKEEATLWSAESGGVEVPQPLVTDDDGQAVDANGNLVWLDIDLYDISVFGETFPWPPFTPEGGGGGGSSEIAVNRVGGTLTAPRLPATVNIWVATGHPEHATEADIVIDESGLTIADIEGLEAALTGKQAADSDLTAVASNGTSSLGLELLKAVSQAAGRTALGLGTASTQATGAFDAAGAAAAAEAAAIAKTFLDAKGDLITASADNTPARLAVGANNLPLVADSAQSGGLKWGKLGKGGIGDLSLGSRFVAEGYFQSWVSSAPGAKAVCYVPIVIPHFCKLTGLVYEVGETKNGKAIGAIYNAAGSSLLAKSASVEQATAQFFQRLPFEAAVEVEPGLYWLALIMESATGTYWGTYNANPWKKETLGSFAAAATFTPPTELNNEGLRAPGLMTY